MSKYSGVCFYESQQNLSLAFEILSNKKGILNRLTEYPSSFQHKSFANKIKNNFTTLTQDLSKLTRTLCEYRDSLLRIDNQFASTYYQSKFINNSSGDNLTSEQSGVQAYTDKEMVNQLISTLEKKSNLNDDEKKMLDYLKIKQENININDKIIEKQKQLDELVPKTGNQIDEKGNIIPPKQSDIDLCQKLTNEIYELRSQAKKVEKKVHKCELNLGLTSMTVWDKLSYATDDIKKCGSLWGDSVSSFSEGNIISGLNGIYNAFKATKATVKHSLIDVSLGASEYVADSFLAKFGDDLDNKFGGIVNLFSKKNLNDENEKLLNSMSNYVEIDGIVKVNSDKINLKNDIEFDKKSTIDKVFTKLINADISGNVKSIYYNYTLSGRNIEKNSTIKYDSLSSEGLSEFGYKTVASAENLVYAVPEGIVQLGENVIIDGVGGMINPEWAADNKTKEWMKSGRENSLSMNLSETNAFTPFKSTGAVYGIVKDASKTFGVAATSFILIVGPILSSFIAGLDKTGSTIQSHASAVINEKGYLSNIDKAKIRANGAIQGTVEGAAWYVTFGQGGLQKLVPKGSKVGAKLADSKFIKYTDDVLEFLDDDGIKQTRNLLTSSISLTTKGKMAIQFAKPWLQNPVNAAMRDDVKFSTKDTLIKSINDTAAVFVYEEFLGSKLVKSIGNNFKAEKTLNVSDATNYFTHGTSKEVTKFLGKATDINLDTVTTQTFFEKTLEQYNINVGGVVSKTGGKIIKGAYGKILDASEDAIGIK